MARSGSLPVLLLAAVLALAAADRCSPSFASTCSSSSCSNYCGFGASACCTCCNGCANRCSGARFGWYPSSGYGECSCGSSGVSGGGIAGMVIGALAFCFCCGALYYCFRRSRGAYSNDTQQTTVYSQGQPPVYQPGTASGPYPTGDYPTGYPPGYPPVAAGPYPVAPPAPAYQPTSGLPPVPAYQGLPPVPAYQGLPPVPTYQPQPGAVAPPYSYQTKLV